jgi:hypothetical protein
MSPNILLKQLVSANPLKLLNRGVALTNRVTDRTKTICLPTKVGRDIIIKFDMYISIWYTKLLRYSNYLSINIPFSHLMLIFDVRISVLMIMFIPLLSIKSF